MSNRHSDGQKTRSRALRARLPPMPFALHTCGVTTGTTLHREFLSDTTSRQVRHATAARLVKKGEARASGGRQDFAPQIRCLAPGKKRTEPLAIYGILRSTEFLFFTHSVPRSILCPPQPRASATPFRPCFAATHQKSVAPPRSLFQSVRAPRRPTLTRPPAQTCAVRAWTHRPPQPHAETFQSAPS